MGPRIVDITEHRVAQVDCAELGILSITPNHQVVKDERERQVIQIVEPKQNAKAIVPFMMAMDFSTPPINWASSRDL